MLENTSQLVVAEGDGEVIRADGDEVQVKYKDGVKKLRTNSLLQSQRRPFN